MASTSSTPLSQYILPGGVGSQYDFWTYYSLLSPGSQRELDELFGASLKHEYPSILLYNFNNDPHLFFRACFILIKESFVALQAWVRLFRTGFRSTLREAARDIVDVTVFQFRPDYCIRMEVRLRDQVRIFSPPAWLSCAPLPVPQPPEYDSSYFADLSSQDSLAAFLNTIPDIPSPNGGGSMLPFAPLGAYDATDAVSPFALGQGQSALEEATASAAGRAFSLGPLTPTSPNPLVQSASTLAGPSVHKSSSFGTAQSDAKREEGVPRTPNGATPPSRPDNYSDPAVSSSSTPTRSVSRVHYSEQSPRTRSTGSPSASGLQRTETMETVLAADGRAQEEDMDDTRTDDGHDSGENYNSQRSGGVVPFSRSEIQFLRDLVSCKRSGEDSSTREMEVDSSLRD